MPRQRKSYPHSLVIEMKKQGLSGEQISRKLKGVITANHVNYLWRQEMAKAKKKGSGGGKKCSKA